jgi:starch-binding outer membrane protein, SusD/RagB family
MKHKITSLSILAAVALFSCSKEKLEPIPQTQISDAVAFSTPARALQQVNGLYSRLKSGQFYAGRYMVYQDVRGEEFLNETNNGVTAFLTWNFTVTPTANEVLGFWDAAFATINRCNVVIEGLATAPISDNLKKNYIAEAKVVRAISYYGLAQLYCRPYLNPGGNTLGLPLRLTAVKSSGFNDLERASLTAVYDQIIKDLNEAEPDLVSDHGTAALNTTRAHKNTAIAFKTRVLLTMGRYADVITEANKLVPAAAPYQASSGYGNRLEANIATVFASPYTSRESILSVPFTSLDLPGTQNSLNSYYNPGPNGNGDYSLNTTGNGIVANAGWAATDTRRNFNQVAGGKTYLRKWPNNAGSNPDWAPVIRYAEVMLNLSEALARQATGIDARALALLNAIRSRSDATHISFLPASKDELINLILTERRIELLGEGFRTTDIGRTGSSFPAKGSIAAVPPTANPYVWPIPNSELITNKLVVQNPGY